MLYDLDLSANLNNATGCSSSRHGLHACAEPVAEDMPISKCHACGVPIHRGSEYLHNDRPYHVPCLVRSLQGEVDAVREQYERLRPHVSDRSVLRGLCQFAIVAEGERRRPLNDDERAALEWLRETAGHER